MITLTERTYICTRRTEHDHTGAVTKYETHERTEVVRNIDGVETILPGAVEQRIPLAEEEFKASWGDASTELLAQVDTLTATLTTVTTERDGLAADKASLETQLTTTTAARDTAITQKEEAAIAATEAATAIAETHAAAIATLQETHTATVTTLQDQLATKTASELELTAAKSEAEMQRDTAEATIIELQIQITELTKDPLVGADQLRIALSRNKDLDTIIAYMSTLEKDNEQRIAWEHAPTFNRASPVFEEAIATSLNFSNTQLDELFAQAASV